MGEYSARLVAAGGDICLVENSYGAASAGRSNVGANAVNVIARQTQYAFVLNGDGSSCVSAAIAWLLKKPIPLPEVEISPLFRMVMEPVLLAVLPMRVAIPVELFPSVARVPLFSMRIEPSEP